MNPARRTLDPRAKLYLLLVANLMLFFHVGLATQIVMVVLFLLPLLAAARWRTALNFGVTYAVLTALGMLDPDALGLPWLHVVSALAVGVTMMLPCFITGAYTFTTTSASAFICAMRRMRVPEAVVIPCVVVIRFFPTIAEDYRQIRNAMALRGHRLRRLGAGSSPGPIVGIHSDSAADERHQCGTGPVGGGTDQGARA